MSESEAILIFHLGSLGDTTVAVPTYREIARRHPTARRYLLSNFAVGAKMVPMGSLLEPMGLIHGSISFPMHLRSLEDMQALRRQLRELSPKTLYYLTPEYRRLAMFRHWLFFIACGIQSFHGIPWSMDVQKPREITPGKLWETEGSRLLRAIGAKEGTDPPSQSERVLDLSPLEKSVANSLLVETAGLERFMAISVGGKVPINDWGDRNWSELLSSVSRSYPDLGLICVGSRDERERNAGLLNAWNGPKLNSCGVLSPRETAALLARAALFVGHDTATLDLAAASGTRVLGIYSARNVPGKWFSGRPGDMMFYQQVPCFGCLHELVQDCPNDLICMKNHDSNEIVNEVKRALEKLSVL